MIETLQRPEITLKNPDQSEVTGITESDLHQLYLMISDRIKNVRRSLPSKAKMINSQASNHFPKRAFIERDELTLSKQIANNKMVYQYQVEDGYYELPSDRFVFGFLNFNKLSLDEALQRVVMANEFLPREVADAKWQADNQLNQSMGWDCPMRLEEIDNKLAIHGVDNEFSLSKYLLGKFEGDAGRVTEFVDSSTWFNETSRILLKCELLGLPLPVYKEDMDLLLLDHPELLSSKVISIQKPRKSWAGGKVKNVAIAGAIALFAVACSTGGSQRKENSDSQSQGIADIINDALTGKKEEPSPTPTTPIKQNSNPDNNIGPNEQLGNIRFDNETGRPIIGVTANEYVDISVRNYTNKQLTAFIYTDDDNVQRRVELKISPNCKVVTIEIGGASCY